MAVMIDRYIQWARTQGFFTSLILVVFGPIAVFTLVSVGIFAAVMALV